MGRTTMLAFFVEPSAGSHSSSAHESPTVMVWPLAALAFLAVTAGLLNSPVTGYWFAGFLGEHEAVEPSYGLMAIAIGVAVGGIALAYASYIKHLIEPDAYFRTRIVRGLLSHKFWMDELYQWAIINPTQTISGSLRTVDHKVVDGAVRLFGWLGLKVSAGLAVFDRDGVDGTVVDGLGDAVNSAGEIRRIHTGNVQTYLILLVAAIVLLAVVFAR
jgi:NADH-quinone oxidoreductase subunit L